MPWLSEKDMPQMLRAHWGTFCLKELDFSQVYSQWYVPSVEGLIMCQGKS